MKGDWLDHLRGKKWSFRIKTKSDYAWNRLATFSVQNPATRSHLDEWLFHKILEQEDILTPRYEFIELLLNSDSLGVYAYEEHFDKQLVESKRRREGPIIKLTEDWVWLGHHRQVHELGERNHLSGREDAAYNGADIRPFKEKRTQENPTLANNFQAAQTLLHQLKFKLKPPAELIDLDRFARYLAIADVLKAYHGIGWHNVRFYYNPITSKLEPIGYDGFGEQPTPYAGGPFVGYKINFDKHPHEYFKYLFTDEYFFRKYIQYLNYYSSDAFMQKTMKQFLPKLRQRAKFIQKEFKKYNYDTLQILDRAEKIHALIQPYGDIDIKVRTNRTANQFGLMIANHHTLPIEVVGFGVKEEEVRDPLARPIFIYSTPKFYAPKFKEIPTNYDVKYVFYRVAGLETVYHAPVVNWQLPSHTTAAQDLSNNKALQLQPGDVYQIYEDRIIFKGGSHQISKDLVIPAGYKVVFEAGCQLDFINNAAFICQSPIDMQGTVEQPIRIYSSDQTANGFTVLEADEKSYLKFVQFDGFNTLQKKDWTLTGAVNFYESEVEIRSCSFINSQCEDAVNIIRSMFAIFDSKIANTYADGLDADFCEGMIDNLSIQDTGNDATDFSGSVINIRRVDIHRAGDKGISVGEETRVNVQSAYINGANIGVASKDLSLLKINLVTMANCKTGFAGYQKKPEFGPARTEVKRYSAEQVGQLYLLDKGSTLRLIDKDITGE